VACKELEMTGRSETDSRRGGEVVEPQLDELVNFSPEFSRAYHEAVYQLEAADLVRDMREHAVRNDDGSGFSISELAERLGVSAEELEHLETGNSPAISYAFLRRVADTCGLTWPNFTTAGRDMSLATLMEAVEPSLTTADTVVVGTAEPPFRWFR
jgi:hypothetical protein